MKRRNYFALWIIPILPGLLLISTGCDKGSTTHTPEAPAIVSQSVTGIYSTGATFKAALKPASLPVTVTFEYGTSLNYGNNAPASPDPIFNTGTNLMANITSLTRGTTYHFRIKAVNQAGTTYSNDLEFVTGFSVGEAYGGGFIIYLDSSGEHGLIAAETDQSEGIIWDSGTNCFKTNVTSTLVGSGKSNTERLVSVLGLGNYPAKICNDLVLNGFNDWFLPSLLELDCLKKSLSVFDRKYNLNGIYYWTSSEAAGTEGTRSCNAWVQNILTGEQRTWPKDDPAPYVRAVRAF